MRTLEVTASGSYGAHDLATPLQPLPPTSQDDALIYLTRPIHYQQAPIMRRQACRADQPLGRCRKGYQWMKSYSKHWKAPATVPLSAKQILL